jgi:hypothetical protein
MKLVMAGNNREVTAGKNRALTSMDRGYKYTPNDMMSVSASTETMHKNTLNDTVASH